MNLTTLRNLRRHTSRYGPTRCFPVLSLWPALNGIHVTTEEIDDSREEGRNNGKRRVLRKTFKSQNALGIVCVKRA